MTPVGESVAPRIPDVLFRPTRTHADDTGALIEIFSENWGFTEAAVPHVYQVAIRPGQVRGSSWIVHLTYSDRGFFSNGCAKVAMFDGREGSPTEGLLDVRFLGEHERGMLVIPPGVWHAVRNVGATDLTFVNLPTRAYDYLDPDKHRLPLENDVIPYVP